MKIYIVLAANLQEYGEFCSVRTEKAYSSKEKAEAYVKSVPTVWNEKINNVNYVCERAIHEIELEGD